jgi:hypothetical protein
LNYNKNDISAFCVKLQARMRRGENVTSSEHGNQVGVWIRAAAN